MTRLHSLSRRNFLRAAGAWGSSALVGYGCSTSGPGETVDAEELITRQASPWNAEPRLDRLTDSWITPIRHFFVRSHGPVPRIDAAAYRLSVEGLVDRPVTLGLPDLAGGFSRAMVAATLICAGNRRNELSRIKSVGGVQWDAGAIGNAEWSGLKLGDLLRRAGLKSGARYVWFEGLDEPAVQGQSTRFGASIPIEKAIRAETLVALEMNGRPLSPQHGYPVRAVVPGYIGARSVKWLSRIVVADRPTVNYFSAHDYKLFPPEVTVETAKWEEREPILEVVLSSAICRPLAKESVPAGRIRVQGYAISPGNADEAVAQVEVSPDNGRTWVRAELQGEAVPFTWRLWETALDLGPGERTLAVRATDSRGRTQPEKPVWNFKGYLCDGWHRVTIHVA
jgi:sulfite oxidase